MPHSFAPILLIAIVGLSIFLMLVRPRGIAEVWWAGAGALLLVVLRLIPPPVAIGAMARGTDVYLFLLGMMLLSALASDCGVFDWASSAAVRHARQSAVRLFTLLYIAGTVVTIAMSNDATAVVLTPAVLSAVNKANAKPMPALFACAMIANAASFVLPISNPANLVVFPTGMPSLGQWLHTFTVPSVLAMAATYAVLRIVFRRDLTGAIDSGAEHTPLTPEGRLVLAGLALVIAALLTASALNLDLGLPTCLAALTITLAISIRTRSNPLRFARQISWSTLLLVAALFVLVSALWSIGLLRETGAALAWAQRLPAVEAVLVTGSTVALANNLVNNLPLGLVAGATLQAAHLTGIVPHAILIGVDLGPNLSVTGSLATILWLLALRQKGQDVSAWAFLKVGFVAMPAALLAALAGLLLQARL